MLFDLRLALFLLLIGFGFSPPAFGEGFATDFGFSSGPGDGVLTLSVIEFFSVNL